MMKQIKFRIHDNACAISSRLSLFHSRPNTIQAPGTINYSICAWEPTFSIPPKPNSPQWIQQTLAIKMVLPLLPPQRQEVKQHKSPQSSTSSDMLRYAPFPNSSPHITVVLMKGNLQSQAKEYNPKIRSHNNDTSIKDPRLDEVGRKQCIAVGNFLASQGVHVTHSLSAPLLRALETACWSFEDMIENGVKVFAIPELQSMANGPNGTGMDLNQLKELYGDDAHNP